MRRLLTILFLVIANAMYAQDVIATLDPKYGVGAADIFFVGDTMLVRTTYDKGKTARQGSESAWYSNDKKIAEVDLSALGSDALTGVMKYGDSLYYYSAEGKGKNVNVDIYRSAGLGTAAFASKIPIDGVLVNAAENGGKFRFITWERKTTSFHLYEFDRGKLANTRDIKMPRDLSQIRENDLTFIEFGNQSRIGTSEPPLKIFIYGEMFCVVYDDTWTEITPPEREGFRTMVFRKNLVTGKEDNDLFYTADKYNFKSYLAGENGKHLYRFVATKDEAFLYVHDLDSNKVLSKQRLEPVTDEGAVQRNGSEHTIMHSNLRDFKGMRSYDDFEMGIIVDDYNGQSVVTYGFISHYKGTALFIGGPMLAASVISYIIRSAMIKLRNDPSELTYIYLIGNPDSGFTRLQSNKANDFIKKRVDDFEFKIAAEGVVDYFSMFAGDKYWIAVHSLKNSSGFIITKFALKP